MFSYRKICQYGILVNTSYLSLIYQNVLKFVQDQQWRFKNGYGKFLTFLYSLTIK